MRRGVVVLLVTASAVCWLMGVHAWGEWTWRLSDHNDGAPREFSVALRGGSIEWTYMRAFAVRQPSWPLEIHWWPLLGQTSWATSDPEWFPKYKQRFRTMNTFGIINLTFWFVVFAAYPVVSLARGPWRRYRRSRRGLCVTCGYNLTGNVSGICPECGSAANCARQDSNLEPADSKSATLSN